MSSMFVFLEIRVRVTCFVDKVSLPLYLLNWNEVSSPQFGLRPAEIIRDGESHFGRLEYPAWWRFSWVGKVKRQRNEERQAEQKRNHV